MPIFMFMYTYQWLLAYSILLMKGQGEQLKQESFNNNIQFIETETKYKLHNRYGQK